MTAGGVRLEKQADWILQAKQEAAECRRLPKDSGLPDSMGGKGGRSSCRLPNRDTRRAYGAGAYRRNGPRTPGGPAKGSGTRERRRARGICFSYAGDSTEAHGSCQRKVAACEIRHRARTCRLPPPRAIPRLGIPRLPPGVESAYSRVARPRGRECAVPGGRVVQGASGSLPEGAPLCRLFFPKLEYIMTESLTCERNRQP